MSERFYLNWPLQPGPVTLEGAEAWHAMVCRLRPGDAVCLFNGDGLEYWARIVEMGRREVSLEIERVATPQRELPFSLEVAAPLPKGDRGQFLIEKLTELGVTSFVPLACERSVIHPGEAKLEKLERYVIEASKQCGRNVLMRIEPLREWKTYVTPRESDEGRWLAHPLGNSTWPQSAPRGGRIAVGPEGGFTDAELAAGREQGWQLVSLGPRILRIETAAIAMVSRVVGGI
jgi:16S rRNA (uracil1498-N3)-methyltransferase